jgi:hypothetical protein
MSQLLLTAYGVNMNRLINNTSRTRLVNTAHVLLAANPVSFLAISGILYLLAAAQLLLKRSKEKQSNKFANPDKKNKLFKMSQLFKPSLGDSL